LIVPIKFSEQFEGLLLVLATHGKVRSGFDATLNVFVGVFQFLVKQA
jgi:hypothetical protein